MLPQAESASNAGHRLTPVKVSYMQAIETAMTTTSFDPVRAAWDMFQATGQCDELAIAPPILRSWQRCVAAGLDAHRDCDASSHRAAVLDEAQAGLVALARPYMEDLYQF